MIKKYKVLNPIGYGGRRERGEIVEMDTVQADTIGPDFLEEVGTGETDTAERENTKHPRKMTVAELREYAEKLGLDTDGSKADLVERIELHLEDSEA